MDASLPSSRTPNESTAENISSEAVNQTTSSPVPVSATPSTKKPPRLRSKVWTHFNKITKEDGETKAKCNYCPKEYPAGSKQHGTSSLLSHIPVCLHNPENKKKDSQSQLNLKPSNEGEMTGTMTTWKFEQDKCRRSLVEMIVIDELPFKHVEGEGFRQFVGDLQPRFNIPSRWTVSRDIYALYEAEKSKLMQYFKSSSQTISITTDTWTSVQKINYLCITAHYIDTNWKLHKKILQFCVVDSHKGDEMGRQLDSCLRDWGIARVFVVTVDNVKSNEISVDVLKDRLIDRGADFVKNAHIHMRCIAHVINLIVGDGLKVGNASIKRVRGAVKYVRYSPQRLKRFKECCRAQNITTKALLSVDCQTRWNSTYLMLNTALKFEDAFAAYDLADDHFRRDLDDGPPTKSDWEIVRVMVDILAVFYELTLRVSAQLYVTSHLAFHEIDTVSKTLRDMYNNRNPDIRAMAVEMQKKFDKYWGHFDLVNKNIYLAVVLDPRCKMAIINFWMKEEFGDEAGAKYVYDLKTILEALYEHYLKIYRPRPQAPPQSSSQANDNDMPPTAKKMKFAIMDKYAALDDDDDDDDLKNDLEIYLGEKRLKKEKDDFDILKWWDTNKCRFPVLCQLARDVYAIPTSTVPSESAFSTGGRVLDAFRSSLTPEIVEALICTQDWLKSSKNMISIEEDLVSLQKYEEGLAEIARETEAAATSSAATSAT